MIAELGHFALILALCVAVLQAVLPFWHTRQASTEAEGLAWLGFVKAATQVQALLVWLAFAMLAWLFALNDFSVSYVAQHSNTHLPLPYRLAATWGSHEGSMLLWVVILAGWSVVVAWRSRQLPPLFITRVLAVLGGVSAGFLAFLLFTSNPFLRLLPPAVEGNDLNPLLQDPGMIFHPPLLYMGYVGFAVAFALAISALLAGRMDAEWARWARPWTTVAWLFLTLGIALGSGWAYYELGWGGWWFWDPVENASFMPWLIGTALIHSLAVTEKRGAFVRWTLLLSIAAFSLSLLGTFLVRSGVLTSVHAFATDPRRGLFILLLLAVVVGGSLFLYAARAGQILHTEQPEAESASTAFAAFSRESFLVVNNVLLLVVGASILLGTLYPLLMDALKLGKISVGPPYFEAVFVPLMVPVVILMQCGPLVRWKADQGSRVLRTWGILMLVSAVLGVALSAGVGHLTWRTVMGLTLACWVFLAAGWQLWTRRVRTAEGMRWRVGMAFAGMWLAHIGVGVFIVGVALVKSLESNVDAQLGLGEQATHGGYTFVLERLNPYPGPNYSAMQAEIRVIDPSGATHMLLPEKRIYGAREMPMTEAAIDVGWLRDVYVSLGEPVNATTWVVRLYLKPFISWIWAGCCLMAAGALLAALDRRYRGKRR